MSLHSRFLIHWTGKDFCDNEDPHFVQDQYLKRLRSTCELGFYMKREFEETDEEEEKEKKIWGVNNKWVLPNIGRVCFSEIRLSQVRRHAERYGGLGIGVHRSFILAREGNPVFYVQNGAKGHVVEQFDVIHGSGDHLAQLLEEAGNNTAAEQVRRTIRDPLRYVMGYLKGMSGPNEERLVFYEEMEWRLVHSERLESDGVFVPEGDGVFRVPVSSREIRIIVFPDDATRKLALKDGFLSDHFRCGRPIVTTLHDCAEF